MNAQEAEKIINAYGAALGSSNDPVRGKSLLPYSVGRIRQAFYVYIDALVYDDLLSQSIGDNLAVSYQELNSFVDDSDAAEIMAAMSRLREGIGSKKDEQRVMEFASPSSRIRAMQELNEYMAECTNIGLKMSK